MATVRIKAAKVPKSKKKVQFKVEIKGELNITAYTACQRVDSYLFTYVGNLLHASEPDEVDLMVGKGLLQWDVPVMYSLPDLGTLGRVGHILVDAQNGDLKLKDSTAIEEMDAHVSRLYQQATSQTRTPHELSAGVRQDAVELPR